MSIDIVYHHSLYLGESIRKEKLDKLKKKLKKRPLLSGLFLITLSRNSSDQLEIYDAKQLAWGYYKKNPPYIIGLAGDYDEALSLIKRIVEECVKSRGDCSLKEYLQCQRSF